MTKAAHAKGKEAVEPAVAPAETKAVAPRAPSTPGFFSDPFSMMRNFYEEVDRIFDDFGLVRSDRAPMFGRFEMPPAIAEMSKMMWAPQVETFERDGKLFVRADLPGINKEEVKLEVHDNVLTIIGERKSEHEEKKDRFFRSERYYGSFNRRIQLPKGIRAESSHAVFKDGVLEVSFDMPPMEEKKPHVLDIK